MAMTRPFVFLEGIPARSKHPAQVEGEGEEPPVRDGVVEKTLAAQTRAICVDALRRERGKIDGVAAREKGPFGIEGRHVRDGRDDVSVVAPQRPSHLAVQRRVNGGARTGLKRVDAAVSEPRLDQPENV